MEALALYQKNAVPGTSEQTTGNGTVVLKSKKIKAAAQKLTHFPEKCSNGHILSHNDMIGNYRGLCFVVKGYICPICHEERGRITRKGNLRTPVLFDWTRIIIPKSGNPGV